MARFSTQVPVESLRPLLETLRRATLAYVDPEGVLHALPVAFDWTPARSRIGIPREGRPAGLGAGAAVALCADAGFHWWELRALLVRGSLVATGAADEGPDTIEWLEIVPRTSRAWDYDRLHEELHEEDREAGDGAR
jgi:hypothetical protein